MLNHIIIHGRMTKDPELKRTQGGVTVTSFTVACDRDYSKEAGKRETDFIDVTAWRQTAEFINQYFRKGQEIIVTGRLQSRSWTDNQNNKRTAWEVQADRVDFCGKKDAGTGERIAAAPAEPRNDVSDVVYNNSNYAPIEGEDGGLPF